MLNHTKNTSFTHKNQAKNSLDTPSKSCYQNLEKILLTNEIMRKLLTTERLAVVSQERLKRTFIASLVFALKGVANQSRYRLNRRLEKIRKFSQFPASNFRFNKLSFQPENSQIWLDCLVTGVYAFELPNSFQTQMLALISQKHTSIDALWNIYQTTYAHYLLKLGSKTFNAPEHKFNKETMAYFINNPTKTHGHDLINSIPPLLENGYIYLNNTGNSQQSEWHRYTFLDSYFKALMTYADVLEQTEIKTNFAFAL